MGTDGRAGGDLAAAALWWGPVLLLDGWLLVRTGGRVGVLLVPVLLGAAIGAAAARAGTPPAVRLRRSGLGALLAHGLLLAALLTALTLHPPRVLW
ncbi:hypothetical protein [Kitasatospora sp. NPDC088134]|uniref:hypothetical protein n=1 Tax=Kitasatospora sp. NPDC088134 TaxID=3364071 RepID=UPI0038265169